MLSWIIKLNAGIWQVEPVIISVLKNITGFEVSELPQTGALVRVYSELKSVAYQ